MHPSSRRNLAVVRVTQRQVVYSLATQQRVARNRQRMRGRETVMRLKWSR
jgi:hypothetical protein